jgi:hypothetical protein
MLCHCCDVLPRAARCAVTHAHARVQTDEDDDDLLETEVDTDVLPFKGIDAALKGEPFLAMEYASVPQPPPPSPTLASPTPFICPRQQAPISFPPSLKLGHAPSVVVPPIQIDAVRFRSNSEEPSQGLPSPLSSVRDTTKKRSQLNGPVTLSTPRLLRTSVSKSIMPSDSEPLSSARCTPLLFAPCAISSSVRVADEAALDACRRSY